MPRNIADFKGDCLIVGGGWCASHVQDNPTWRTREDFFTIDKNRDAEPDQVANITDEKILSDYTARFKFIYFERIPLINSNVGMAFKNAHKMLTADGVLLYYSGSRDMAESIPSMLIKAGFAYAIKKALDPEDPKMKYDKGSLSLAAKSTPINQSSDIAHLPASAQRYILEHYKFFNPEPFVTGCKSIRFAKKLPTSIGHPDPQRFLFSPSNPYGAQEALPKLTNTHGIIGSVPEPHLISLLNQLDIKEDGCEKGGESKKNTFK